MIWAMATRTALTLGNFDGPHVGHTAIVKEARRLANEHADDTRVVAITFDPPPLSVLRPGQEPPQLVHVDERVRRLREAGADDVEVITPTHELLQQTAEEFVEHLVERHHPVAVVEGPDFRFGRGRQGDMAFLESLGERHGFATLTVPRVEAMLSDLQVVPVSSSLIRWLVGRGRVADAATCLGRPFSLTAPVVQGEQRGRRIGIPTANLDQQALKPFIIPADGVYAGYATLDNDEAAPRKDATDASAVFAAAISIGTKPTFGQAALTVEAHLLDTDVDLYGRTLTIHFARWVRDQYPFPGVEPLIQQLQRDIAVTRGWHEQGLLLATDSSYQVPA